MKQFAVAGEKAGSVGPHCPALLAQAKLHREPVQLQQAETTVYDLHSVADQKRFASDSDNTFILIRIHFIFYSSAKSLTTPTESPRSPHQVPRSQ